MNFKKILMLGGAVAVMTSGAIVQQAKAADTDSLTVDAVIVATLVNTCATPIDFGNIEPHATLADTVIIDTAGLRTTGAGNATVVGGGAPGAGQCIVTASDIPYDFDIASDTIDDAGAGAPMAVDTFMVSVDGGADTAVPVAPTMTGGTDTINIGATLHVAAAQTPGTYTGTVTVTAGYQ